MTGIAVVAGKASPGATTVAAALTLSFPQPVLLIDADPAGGDVVPGLLPGRASTETGLLSWLVATRHQAVMDATALLPEHALALPEAGDAWVLGGLQSAAQAGVLGSGGWARLATCVERGGSVLGRDVIVDVGRLGERSGWPVVTTCDLVLLVVRPTARSVQAASGALQLLRSRLGDLERVRLVVNGAGPYTPTQVADALQYARGVDQIPADPKAAAALVDGAASSLFRLSRSRLLRATGALADRITAQLYASTSTTDLPSLNSPDAAATGRES